MNTTGFNGWRNYPTWAMDLWINNDSGSYWLMRDLMIESDNVLEFAERLEETFDVSVVDDLSGAASDLLTWACGQISWEEIAATEWDQEAWDDAHHVDEEE